MDVFFKVMGYLMAGAGGLGIIRYINTDNPSDLKHGAGNDFLRLARGRIRRGLQDSLGH